MALSNRPASELTPVPRDADLRRVPAAAEGRAKPLSMADVALDADGYWGRWQEVNAANIVWHCHEWMTREGWIHNFEAAASGALPAQRRGREFTDSDVFKLIEAMSWEQGRRPDPRLEDALVALIDTIAAAQEPDGYLNTNFGRPGQAPRYADLEWGSELYNYGHLLQAAVARVRSSGPDRLLEVATRVADHVCDVFGEGGIESVCGHPEIELGLIEFARLTGVERYREQAALFLERRGHRTLADIEFGRGYFQDDVPIREATVFRGHAVRATYLAAAAVDLAVDRDDAELLQTVRGQLDRTLATRTYITGGMGSHHQDEAYGSDFELPSDRAYAETCAGVGLFMLAWRLLLATDDARYGDLMERVLFNVIATSPSADGREFFYVNTLHQRALPDPADASHSSLQVVTGGRAPWFRVSCCPTNVSRTLSTLDGYVAVAQPDGLGLVLYTDARIRTRLEDGREVAVDIHTHYPDDGRVTIHVPGGAAAPWSLRLRIPGWADAATVRRGDGRREPASRGWFVIRVGGEAETIELDLALRPRIMSGDPRIDATRAAAAVEYGPRVYCIESVDLPAAAHVDRFVLDPGRPLRVVDDAIVADGVVEDLPDPAWPYGEAGGPPPSAHPVSARLTPYNEWARRGPSTMRVWMRAEERS